MDKFRARMIQFMTGRNGPDELYRFSMMIYLVLAVVNIFARSGILALILWILFIWGTFRCFSKNVYKRQRENIKFLQLTEGIRKKASMARTVLTDKEHYYKKCSACRTYLRLPRKKGEHTAVCPKCKNKMFVKIR